MKTKLAILVFAFNLIPILNAHAEDSTNVHPGFYEISVDVDSTKQARYFEQAEYGKFTRAALLGLILNENGF